MDLLIYRDKSFAERRTAAIEAKKALLEKFKAKPAPDDPAVLAKQAERKAILEAREKRAAEKEKLRQEKLAREAEERAEREAPRKRHASPRKKQPRPRLKRVRLKSRNGSLGFLPTRLRCKAKRDARYAARKARKR